ncbi:GyrI-like domain-containing protein [Halobacillus campisalis]|uniref:GyrI-like domain-containing protein n=1 Tax=Halobacillus campisalis TaxID=435909 RepID=A0ABW2JZY7_9BACI|nr:GyrI-like domain-containing protein [Halobacillus campisalis]
MKYEKPGIKQLAEMTIVGFRVQCKGSHYIHEIPKASAELDRRKNEIGHLVSPLEQFGAFVVDEETAEEEGYWVGFPVHTLEKIPEGMVSLTIPAQTYASLPIAGNNEQIVPAYEFLQQWMEKHDYPRLLNKWHLEKYTKWDSADYVEVDLLDTTENKH